MLGWELWDVSHFIEVYSWQYSILCSDISRASSEPTCFFHVSTKSWFLISVFNETDLSEAGLFLMSTDYDDFYRASTNGDLYATFNQTLLGSRTWLDWGLHIRYYSPKTASKSHSTWGVFYSNRNWRVPQEFVGSVLSITSTNVVNSIMTPKRTLFFIFSRSPTFGLPLCWILLPCPERQRNTFS